MSNRNREAGHNFERDLVQDFTLIPGYETVATSRSCNLFRDAQKVDLAFKDESIRGRMPFNIQAKCLAKTPNISGLMSEMPKDCVPNVIMYRATEKRGNKFFKVDDYAILRKSTFLDLLKENIQLKNKLKNYEQDSND